MLFDWCDQGPHICIDAHCLVLLLLEQLVYFQQAATVIMVLFPLYGRAKKLPAEIVTVPASVSATGQKMPGTFPRRHL